MEKLEVVKEQIESARKEHTSIPEVTVNTVNLLFLDVSSTCTGYFIVNLDISKVGSKVKAAKAGAFWFDNKWDHQDKYSYLFHAILTYFEVVENVDYIVHEAYSINKKKMQGALVTPEMIGALKVAAKENGVKVDSILPQTWRSQLGIKPIISKGSRDYKTPTIEAVKKLVDIPDKTVSNITKKERATPNDLADAIGVGLGWLKKQGFTNISFEECEFNTHLGIIDM